MEMNFSMGEGITMDFSIGGGAPSPPTPPAPIMSGITDDFDVSSYRTADVTLSGNIGSFKNFLENDLGWFQCTISDTTLYGYMDGVLRLRCDQNGTVWIPGGDGSGFTINNKKALVTAGYKTSKGWFLYQLGTASNWAFFGETNNGDKCTVMSSGSTANYFLSSAIGEDSGDAVFAFAHAPNSYSVWANSTQVAYCPIPTHPDAGKSYINGMVALMIAPFAESFGSNVRAGQIGGRQCITNGYIALFDD